MNAANSRTIPRRIMNGTCDEDVLAQLQAQQEE